MSATFKSALPSASSCDSGDIRHINNDRVLSKKYTINNEEWGLFVVADGMGTGNEKGRTTAESSQIVIDTLSAWWDKDLATMLSIPYEPENIIESLDNAIKLANTKTATMQIGKLKGTTLSLLLIMGRKYSVKHVGNSRIYKINNRSGISMLTEDHTYAAVQIKAGMLTLEDAEVHPNRNALTRCLGTNLMPEIFEIDGDIESGDMFLICSDGFYRHISEESMLDIVTDRMLSVEDKLQALRMKIQYGNAQDNVSIILTCPTS